MFFAAIGAIIFIGGILLAFNVKKSAERALAFYSQFTPRRGGSATPATLRFVGSVWIPMGAFFIAVGIFR